MWSVGAPRWIFVVLGLNAALAIAHFVVFGLTRSQLVLAQGADSLTDVAVNAMLAVSTWVGRKPKDANHPFGHGRAEPIGALVAAVLAFVLAIEVGRSALALEAALGGRSPALDTSAAGVLAAKLGVKILFLVALSGRARRERSPALRAVVTDTRNDVAATSTSILGWLLVRAGTPSADAALALPICLYIAYNGATLARENLRYLMGEAPGADVTAALRAAAAAVPGVKEVPHVAAHHVGSQIHVEIVIVVDPRLTATEGHDIGVRVQREVEAADVVARAFIHVDTSDTRGA